MFNKLYLNKLLIKNRIGTVIRYIQTNVFNFSIDNFQYIIDRCHENNSDNMFLIIRFMLEHFNYINKKCINIYKYYENELKYINEEITDHSICDEFIDNRIFDIYRYYVNKHNIKKEPMNIFGNNTSEAHIHYANNATLKFLLSKEMTILYPMLDPYSFKISIMDRIKFTKRKTRLFGSIYTISDILDDIIVSNNYDETYYRCIDEIISNLNCMFGHKTISMYYKTFNRCFLMSTYAHLYNDIIKLADEYYHYDKILNFVNDRYIMELFCNTKEYKRTIQEYNAVILNVYNIKY